VSERKCSVLVVDDEPYLIPTLCALLQPDFEVLSASGAQPAITILLQRPVDIILTDQRMPGWTGVQLLEWVRQHRPDTVRLLMTGYSELDDAVDAINRGHVYYYLLKPWRTEDFLQVVRNAADKFRLERKREELLRELQALNRELERRVSDRTRQLEEANQLLQQRTRELERLALTDPLTGLFNRRAIEELARFELKRHARYPSALSLGLVDIDFFKRVNTEHLLTGGDEALKGVARILSGCIREVDSVGRVGGEEFLVIARETGTEGAAVLAERIRAAVEATPIDYNGRQIRLTVSVGFAVAEPGVPAEQHELTHLAAEALAVAKDSGRNRCEIRVPGSSGA
jgi:diguanylate cyclase (GGDEF)-like protein